MSINADEPGARLNELHAFYRADEEVTLATLPAGSTNVVARRALGDVVEAKLGAGPQRGARFAPLPAGTYSVEALGADGSVLAEELTTVGSHAGERPVHGFATSFLDEDVPGVLEWLRALRCTVVQIYDWMATYCEPLGPRAGWKDPSNRPVSYDALRALAAGIREGGAVAHAYAPVYAVDLPFAAEHPDLLMYEGSGAPERFFDLIQLADPANKQWQQHFATAYGSAADSIGFDGFHIDTYGYPRAPLNGQGRAIDMREAYEEFLVYFRTCRPVDQISFNQVNGVPSAANLPEGPGFRYCEVWPPNDGWRHLEALMDRSSGQAGRLGQAGPGGPVVRGSIACYPPVWGTNDPAGPIPETARAGALRTVVSTEAVATCLGSSALLYGDLTAVLCDPYYPKHQRLTTAEAGTVLAWHRFALRHRDLFLEGEDTSWYDVADDNGAVTVDWDGGPARPEPVGGAVFARVVRAADYVAVGVVDLTGSPQGRWSEHTAAGRCRSVRVRVLLDDPDRWEASVAVLGRGADRLAPASFTVVEHREGRAALVELPLDAGWSVLRMTGPR